MTMIADPHSVPTASSDAGAMPERMPPVVRRAVVLTVACVMGFAAYLVTVRGEALLLDLTALGRGLWCF